MMMPTLRVDNSAMSSSVHGIDGNYAPMPTGTGGNKARLPDLAFSKLGIFVLWSCPVVFSALSVARPDQSQQNTRKVRAGTRFGGFIDAIGRT